MQQPQQMLHSPSRFLAPLEHDLFIPTPNEHAKRTYGFAAYTLATAIDDDPHYEASLYGPVNQVLFAVFPPDRYYSVKPQALIRPVLEEDIPDSVSSDAESSNPDADEGTDLDVGIASVSEWNDSDIKDDGDDDNDGSFKLEDNEQSDISLNIADVSKGTWGALHQSEGLEPGKRQPDFIISKYVVRGPGDVIQVPIMIVEVKRRHKKIASAVSQTSRYMEAMLQQPNSPGYLVGFLIAGNVAYYFDYRNKIVRSADGSVVVVRIRDVSRPIDIRSDSRFAKLLSLAAVSAWNDPLMPEDD